MTEYVTKPRRVKAIRWDGSNEDEVTALAGGARNALLQGRNLVVLTSGGAKLMTPGDWLIRDQADGWTHAATPETFERVWQADAES
jgi:hypothetical protein